MPLNSDYLQELSDLFVADVRKSAYYAQLSDKERGQFDAQVEDEEMRGLHPLLPGAAEEELAELSKAVRKELGILLPTAAVEILRQVDGFVENGVSLYGVDPEFRDDHFDSGPGILAENQAKWSAYADMAQSYLFIGDSDLWFFVIEMNSGQPLALNRSTFTPEHSFGTVEEMVNDMMRQALGYFDDDEEEHPIEGPGSSPENLFFRN
jgi:hypothetical protein